MKLIRLTDLKISSNRQRSEFDPDAMNELRESIRCIGLHHAVVVREVNNEYWLVAGERRLKAITELYELGKLFKFDNQLVEENFIPVVTLGELTELEAEEAELDENIKRKDLTWQEHARAVNKLLTLRSKQAEAVGKTFTIADTAEELTGRRDGSFHDTVKKTVIVSNHLDNPAVAGAKNVSEAYKILKQENEREKNIQLAVTVGKSFTAEKHEVYNMDCLTFMRERNNAERFDVILTDPPYGMNAQSFNDGSGKLIAIDHEYDDTVENWVDLMTAWAELSYKVAKAQAHCYVFCDIDNFPALKNLMKGAGWYVFRTPLIHYKPGSGRVPLPEHGPRRQYEFILYAIKGKKPVTAIYPDVISTRADESTGHGAQKPVELFTNLLQRSVKPGDEILDSFAGSGTIIPAAHGFKCKAVAIEMSQASYGLCLKRIQELKNI